jgi:hypothetical protein
MRFGEAACRAALSDSGIPCPGSGVRRPAILPYQIEGDRVILSQGPPVPAEDPFATFSEWDSEADRAGYAGL